LKSAAILLLVNVFYNFISSKSTNIKKIATLIKNNRLIFNNQHQTKTDKFAYLVFCISSYNGEFEFFSFDVFSKNAAEQCLCKPSRKNSLQKAQ
jgi:hypothetical protein